MDGILLLDKSPGITSARAIAEVKRRVRAHKIGHAGTLDPLATGLLICLLGKATKWAPAIQGGYKVYTGAFRFGESTTTDDREGEVITRSDEIPSIDTIRKSAHTFVGAIEQIPPRVSAVKVKGARAYDLARTGASFTLSPRTVTVESFDVFTLENTDPHSREFGFRIRCSSGTYIRSLARDIGAALGCGACVSELRREVSEPFLVTSARTIDMLELSDVISLDTLERKEGGVCHRS